MRLIDADKFIEYLGLDAENAREENLGDIVTLEDFDRQPTAYDADKVVDRLEKDTELAYNRYMDCAPNTPQSVVARYSAQYQERKRCLDIVKSGGIE